jgi:hypothetical protein
VSDLTKVIFLQYNRRLAIKLSIISNFDLIKLFS